MRRWVVSSSGTLSIQTRVTLAVLLLMGANVVLAWTMGRSVIELKTALVPLKTCDRQGAPEEPGRAATTGSPRLDLAEAGQRSQEVLSGMAVKAVVLPTVTIFLVVLLLASTFRRVDRQLEAIYRSASEFGRGERNIQVPELARDELGQLAATLNRMIVELREVTVPRCDHDEMKARLAKVESELGQALRFDEVGKLAGSVAHDLNSLLTVIRQLTVCSMESLPEGHPPRDDLKTALKAIGKASNLVRRIFHADGQADPEPANLNEEIDVLTCLLKRNLSPKIVLKLDLAKDLWPVKIDRTHVEQVLLNLVVNARDAMPSGGSLTIETKNLPVASLPPGVPLADAADRVILVVEDTGCGIDQTVQARIFEPFFTTKSSKGTGLGLSICQEIVQQAGGSIGVQSTPGRGTRFVIELPRHRLRSERAALAAGIDRNRGSETVLLVAGERVVRKQAAMALSRHGYAVREAPDEPTANTSLQGDGGAIDLLLLDLGSTDGGAIDLAMRFKEARPHARVLLLSTPDGESTAPVGTWASILEKPYVPDRLIRAVRKTLDGAIGRLDDACLS